MGDQSISTKTTKGNRQRASSLESFESILTSSFSSKSALMAMENIHNGFSKDDHFMITGMGMGTITNQRHRFWSNDSPKMTQILFDLNYKNDFITTNDAKSVVTNSFTLTHDDHFKLFEDHF